MVQEKIKSEGRIQQDAFAWHWNNHPAERGLLHANNNNSDNKIKGNLNKAMGVVAGVADMEYYYQGRIVFIEFKTPEGRQSPDQVRFQALVEAHGFTYAIVRSVDEFKQVIENTRKKFTQ